MVLNNVAGWMAFVTVHPDISECGMNELTRLKVLDIYVGIYSPRAFNNRGCEAPTEGYFEKKVLLKRTIGADSKINTKPSDIAYEIDQGVWMLHEPQARWQDGAYVAVDLDGSFYERQVYPDISSKLLGYVPSGPLDHFIGLHYRSSGLFTGIREFVKSVDNTLGSIKR